MKDSRSIEFGDAFSYGWDIVKNVFLYYLAFSITGGVGLVMLEEGSTLFITIGLLSLFLTVLSLIALHIAIYYKIWIDIRNNSVNFAYTDTQEQYQLQKEKERNNRNEKYLRKRGIKTPDETLER